MECQEAPPMTSNQSFHDEEPSMIEEFKQMVYPMHMPVGIGSFERDEGNQRTDYPEIFEYPASTSYTEGREDWQNV
jgi:hypothetical protein